MRRKIGIQLVYLKELQEHDLAYFKEYDPLCLSELLTIIRELSTRSAFKGPFIHDMREVNLLNMKPSDMNRHIVRLKNQVKSEFTNPCAFVVRNEDDLRIVRMWGVLAEFAGIRKEDDVFATTSLDEAISWVAYKLGLDNPTELSMFVEKAEAEAQKVR